MSRTAGFSFLEMCLSLGLFTTFSLLFFKQHLILLQNDQQLERQSRLFLQAYNEKESRHELE